MRVWLMRASELMPVVDGNDHLLRMGLLGEKLSEKSHDVTWFASTFNHFKKKQYSDIDTIVDVADNYRLNLIKTPSYKKNISISRIINHKVLAIKLKRKIKNMEIPDLIFASFPTIEMAYEAIKYGKKNNVPVIVDVRDLWPDTFKHNLHGIIKMLSFPFVWYLEKKTHYIMKNAYSITSISSLMLNWALEKGKRIKTENDEFFYIGYKSKSIDNVDKKKLSFQIKLKKNKSYVCFFATINNQFNYSLIVDVAKKLENKNIDIIVCGQGPKLEMFQSLSKTKGVDNILFLGWQEKANLDYILDHSIAGFAPYNDTFDFQMSVSNKFAEYLSHSLPVVITSSGYMKQLIYENKIGFASDNVDELCNFFVNISKNEKLRNELSNNAIELYRKMFDADIIYEEMSNFLEKICKEYEEK